MEAFSALLAICAGNSPVTGEFPAQRPVTRSFDVLFDLRPNKRLSKRSWGWWFETPFRPLWRHSNEYSLSRKSLHPDSICTTWCLREMFMEIYQLDMICGPSNRNSPPVKNGVFKSLMAVMKLCPCVILTSHRTDLASIHDDIIKWKHFPRYWPFVRGIHRSPVNSPHKGQWRRALMFPLICMWINGWVNNGEAGDVRRHLVHYDVTVMWMIRKKMSGKTPRGISPTNPVKFASCNRPPHI